MCRLSIRTLSLLGFLLCGDIAYSQRYLTIFGALSELRAPRDARGLAQGDFNGDGTADLLAWSPLRLMEHLQSSSGESWKTSSMPFSHQIRALATGRLNRDKADDLVVLTEDPLTLSAWTAGKREGFIRRWQVSLAGQFDALVVGDLNSDGRGDILAYGRKELGVLAFPGNGDGTFDDPVMILPEYSFGSLVIADVNKDGLHDLFAANWLSNQVLVYENFGKFTFGEPTALKLPFEPGLLWVARVDSDINEDLVVAGGDSALCRVYLGDGLGGYHPDGEVSFSSTPEALFFADVNGDRASDVVALCPAGKTLEVALNDGSGRLGERVTIAGGQQPAAAAVFPQAPGGAMAAAVLDAAVNKIRLFASARRRHATSAVELLLATGKRPEAVAIVDLNRDGWKDLLVADAGSRDVAAYFNDSVRSFSGMVPFQSTANMAQLVHVVRRRGAHLLVGGVADSDAVAILEIDPKSYAHSTTLVPAAGRLEVLGAVSTGGRLKILGLGAGKGDRLALLEFDELGAGRFTERDLLAGRNLLAAAAGNPDAEKPFPVAYVERNQKSGAEDLFVSRDGGAGNLAASFATQAPAQLWMADLNRDGDDDVIVSFGPPENSLKFVLSAGGGWGTPVALQARIAIASRSQLAVLDFNGDGLSDLVIQNSLTQTIDLLQARRAGSFLPPSPLATAEGSGGFAVGDLDNDGVPDLAVTDAVNGGLRIISLGGR